MNFVLYSCFALPPGAALYTLYFILLKAGLHRESLIAKCAVTFLSVASAGFAVCLKGGNPLAEPAFWFFVLCTGADALLEIRFVPGMLLFGGAHFCLIVWMVEMVSGGGNQMVWTSVVVWLPIYTFTLILFRKELQKLGRRRLPFCLYSALLSASFALGLTVPFVAGETYLTLALGILCFYVSDMMVGKATLSSLPRWCQKPTMGLYWGGLYLISAALWI